MELRMIGRKCWKLILCTLFLTATLSAALIFLIQYILDGIGMEYTAEAYASVGTVYQSDVENAAFTPLSEEALSLLSESEYVQNIDIRSTFSAKVPGMVNFPCFFKFAQTNHIVFFRGTVTDCEDMPAYLKNSLDTEFQMVTIVVEKIYAGQSNWITTGEKVYGVIQWYGETDCKVTEGEEYYFFATSTLDDSNGLLNTDIIMTNYTEEYFAKQMGNDWGQKSYELFHDTVIAVPDGMDAEKADAYALELIKQRGMEWYIDEIRGLEDTYTVHTSQDMQMLIPVVNETMFFTDGRGIRPDDAGKNVCVISRRLAQLHNLEVGDKIPIALGDNCYNWEGYESGYPAFGEPSRISYGSPMEYEIVGMYDFVTYHPSSADLLFGHNDIFIPEREDSGENVENVYPYAFSFRVSGIDQDDFVDQDVVELADKGYFVQMSVSDWEEVEQTYNAMESRRKTTLICAGIVFVLGTAVYLLLLLVLYRREFALRELFGASFGHTSKAYRIPFLVSAFLADVLAVLAVEGLYIVKLMPQSEGIAPGRVPVNAEILPLLVLIILVQGVISYIVLLIIVRKLRNKSILKLLK